MQIFANLAKYDDKEEIAAACKESESDKAQPWPKNTSPPLAISRKHIYICEEGC